MTATLEHHLVGPRQGETYGVVGHKYRLLATGAQTGGAYAIIEGLIPQGEGPPPHVHVNEDETFYVVEGAVTISIEGVESRAGPGAFVLVPKGTLHTFRNDEAEPARILITVVPAGFEAFFKLVGIPITDPDADPPPSTIEHMRKVVERAPEFGLVIHA